MLPKPERNRKKDSQTPEGEQLDLLLPITNEKNARKNRFWVILLFLITVGSSLIFSLYRSVVNSPYRLSRFRSYLSIPNLNRQSLSPQTPSDLSAVVDPIISRDPNSWSIFVQTLPPDSGSFRWGRNTDPLFSVKSQNLIITELNSLPPTDTPSLLTKLPQGSVFHETEILANGSYQLNSLVTVPNKQLLLLFKVSGSDNLDKSKNLIPILAESIYWHLMSGD